MVMQMMLNLMQIAYVYISHTITQTQAACDDVKKKKKKRGRPTYEDYFDRVEKLCLSELR